MHCLVYDVECTNLRSDIGSLLVVSFAELDSKDNIVSMVTRDILDISGEYNLVRWAKNQYESADVLIGFNQLAFDRHYLDGVLTRYNQPMLGKRLQIDCYQIAKGKFALQSSSLANLADFFRVKEQKDRPSKHEWREAAVLDREAISRLRERCESDVRITAEVFKKLKPVFYEKMGR